MADVWFKCSYKEQVSFRNISLFYFSFIYFLYIVVLLLFALTVPVISRKSKTVSAENMNKTSEEG